MAQASFTFEVIETPILASKCSQSSRFHHFQGRFKKIYMLVLGRPRPAKIAARMLPPEKLWPFEIYLPITWNALIFDRTYLGFPRIELNDFFTKTKEAILIYNVLASFDSQWA